MNINMEFDNNLLSLRFKNICLILGDNDQGKTYLINCLEDGFNGATKSEFSANGLKIYKGDYNVVKISDLDTFSTEFKLSRNNVFRKLIYADLIGKMDINKEKNYIDKLNELLIGINDEIRTNLNRNIYDNKMKLVTEIDSIDKIIERFTNIYIEDDLFSDKTLSKGKGRELLYKLSISLIKSKQENQILLIDGIDNYLTGELLVTFINKLIELGNENIKIIITGTSPLLFKYFYGRADIYTTKSKKVHKINNFDSILTNTILKVEHSKNIFNLSYNSYVEQNLELVTVNDIDRLYKDYFYPNLLNIGLIYSSTNIKLVRGFEADVVENSIIYRDNTEYYIYKLICERLGIDLL